MSYKGLVIIDNEKISKKNNIFYCDNFEARISEDFKSNFDVTFIARKSKVDRVKKIDLQKIEIASNIFSFLFNIFKTFKKNETTYLLIAINPYTFISFLFLFIFRKKVFVYLRSDGHEEYKAILGHIGPIIYNLMYRIVTFKSKIITCQKRLFTNRKSYMVYPSELNFSWLNNRKKPLIENPKLLYVGRIKVEKGVFSLIKIFEKIKDGVQLSIVGRNEKIQNENKKINFIGHVSSSNELIKIYDSHNIFILPSFTEAHPKVIDESLARMRPVIIFDDIRHVIQDRKGIFVSKRNTQSLEETINFIMKNYSNIQESMIENKLPTKKEFVLQMINILNLN